MNIKMSDKLSYCKKLRCKRDAGVPTSQQGIEVLNTDKRGVVQPGRAYQFTNNKREKVIIRNHLFHIYPDNPAHNRGTHFNTPNGEHYDY